MDFFFFFLSGSRNKRPSAGVEENWPTCIWIKSTSVVMSQESESVGKVYRVQDPEAPSASTGTRRANQVKICRHAFNCECGSDSGTSKLVEQTFKDEKNKQKKNPKSLYIHFTLLWFVPYFSVFTYFYSCFWHLVIQIHDKHHVLIGWQYCEAKNISFSLFTKCPSNSSSVWATFTPNESLQDLEPLNERAAKFHFIKSLGCKQICRVILQEIPSLYVFLIVFTVF